ncbi:MAG: cache domain-containing protein [Pseudomonadota bacterium]
MRLVLSFGVLSCVVGMFAATGMFLANDAAKSKTAESGATFLADSYAQSTAEIIMMAASERLSDIEIVHQNVTQSITQDGLDPTSLNALLTSVADGNPDIDWLGIASLEGTIIATSNPDLPSIGFGSDTMLIGGLSENFIGRVHNVRSNAPSEEASTGNRLLPSSLPIEINGKPVAVLISYVDITQIDEKISAIANSDDIDVAILASDGRRLLGDLHQVAPSAQDLAALFERVNAEAGYVPQTEFVAARSIFPLDLQPLGNFPDLAIVVAVDPKFAAEGSVGNTLQWVIFVSVLLVATAATYYMVVLRQSAEVSVFADRLSKGADLYPIEPTGSAKTNAAPRSFLNLSQTNVPPSKV